MSFLLPPPPLLCFYTLRASADCLDVDQHDSGPIKLCFWKADVGQMRAAYFSYLKCAHSWYQENKKPRTQSRWLQTIFLPLFPSTFMACPLVKELLLLWDDGRSKVGRMKIEVQDFYTVGVLLNQSPDDGILATAFWCHLAINDSNDKCEKNIWTRLAPEHLPVLTQSIFDQIRSSAIRLGRLDKDWWCLYKGTLTGEVFTSFVFIQGSSCSINYYVKQYGRYKSANKVTWGVTMRASAGD